MFFLAILSAAQCDQFYPGCTQNYKDILGSSRYLDRSHFIRFYTLIKLGQFREKIHHWQILWRNIFRLWLQFLPVLEVGELEQFLYDSQHHHQGLPDFHQWKGKKTKS